MRSITFCFFSLAVPLGLLKVPARFPAPEPFPPFRCAVVVTEGSAPPELVFFLLPLRSFPLPSLNGANNGCPRITGGRAASPAPSRLFLSNAPFLPSFTRALEPPPSSSPSTASGLPEPASTPSPSSISLSLVSYRSTCLSISRIRNSTHKHCHSSSLLSLLHDPSNPNLVCQCVRRPAKVFASISSSVPFPSVGGLCWATVGVSRPSSSFDPSSAPRVVPSRFPSSALPSTSTTVFTFRSLGAVVPGVSAVGFRAVGIPSGSAPRVVFSGFPNRSPPPPPPPSPSAARSSSVSEYSLQSSTPAARISCHGIEGANRIGARRRVERRANWKEIKLGRAGVALSRSISR